MDMQPVESRPAERWDQGRMYIDDLILILPDDRLADNGHKARQHNQLNLEFLQQGKQSGVIILLCKPFAQQYTGGNPRLLSAFQRKGVRSAGNHQRNGTILYLPGCLGVNQRL